MTCVSEEMQQSRCRSSTLTSKSDVAGLDSSLKISHQIFIKPITYQPSVSDSGIYLLCFSSKH